jgi:hypothetical protein
MINARAESVAEKPTFKNAFRKGRRCLVLADGYYEWAATAEGKAPARFFLRSGEPFAFAGPQCIGVISSARSKSSESFGSMLYRGGLSASKSSKSLTNGKALATSTRRAKKENRPHTDPSFWPGRRDSPMFGYFRPSYTRSGVVNDAITGSRITICQSYDFKWPGLDTPLCF